MHRIVESIVKHEGFRTKPYPDPIHGWKVATFGHGLTYITEEESLEIVRRRVVSRDLELHQRIEGYQKFPSEIKGVLIEMAYQMGTSGLLGFKKFLGYLRDRDYKGASEEMMDSLWATQTPNRASDLSDRVRNT